MPQPHVEALARFAPEPSSAGEARRFVRHELEGRPVPDPPLENAVLLVSELVSNAILHARTEMTVRLVLSPGCVRAEVHDGNTRRPIAAGTPVDATSGRGMMMLQTLAETWGIEGTHDGKIIWFELPIDI